MWLYYSKTQPSECGLWPFLFIRIFLVFQEYRTKSKTESHLMKGDYLTKKCKSKKLEYNTKQSAQSASPSTVTLCLHAFWHTDCHCECFVLSVLHNCIGSQESVDSMDSVVTRLWAGWYRAWFSAGPTTFSLLQTTQTDSGGPSSLLFSGYQGSFPGDKAVRVWGWLSSPSSVEVKNERTYTSAPNVCLYGLARDNVTFTKLCWDTRHLNTSVKCPRHCSVAVPEATAETACSQQRHGVDITV